LFCLPAGEQFLGQLGRDGCIEVADDGELGRGRAVEIAVNAFTSPASRDFGDVLSSEVAARQSPRIDVEMRRQAFRAACRRIALCDRCWSGTAFSAG
jgi:hypothetical protein